MVPGEGEGSRHESNLASNLRREREKNTAAFDTTHQ